MGGLVVACSECLVAFGAGAVFVGDVFFDKPEFDGRTVEAILFAELSLHETFV